MRKQKVTRRDFLRAGTAAGLGLTLAGLAEAAAKKKIPIGLQVYSLREQAAKDLPGVLETVAKMGYKGVEFAGYYNHEAPALRKMLDANGLVCCGTHAQYDTLKPDKIDATIEFNKVIGNKYLIVPYMPAAGRQVWLDRAKEFNELAEKVKPHGMLVGYHAHAHDFEKVEGGQRAWDVFFGNTKREVVMQMDTGNCLDGKADPVAVLKQYPGRAVTIHLKEHGGDAHTVIGQGEVKWADVFRLCEADVTEWYIVEHERGGADSIGDVKRCLDELRKMGKL